MNHLGFYGLEIENKFMKSVKSILKNFGKSMLKKVPLLYGNSRLDVNKNRFFLEATLIYIKTTDRFSGSIFGLKILPYSKLPTHKLINK